MTLTSPACHPASASAPPRLRCSRTTRCRNIRKWISAPRCFGRSRQSRETSPTRASPSASTRGRAGFPKATNGSSTTMTPCASLQRGQATNSWTGRASPSTKATAPTPPSSATSPTRIPSARAGRGRAMAASGKSASSGATKNPTARCPAIGRTTKGFTSTATAP